MKIILAFLSIIGIFFIIGGVLFTIGGILIDEEQIMKIEIVSTSHTVTGGYADVKIIESEEPKCYYIEDGFKIYENGEKIPLY